jgi:hypothetical protein
MDTLNSATEAWLVVPLTTKPAEMLPFYPGVT